MAAGDLDTTFAGNGKKRISFGGDDEARAVLVQPNGRIVLAGLGTAARLLVTLDGSGDVRYFGDPAVTPRVDGSGDLTHAD